MAADIALPANVDTKVREGTRTARWIVIAYFVGVYTSFSVFDAGGSLVVPYAIANSAGLFGALLYWRRIVRLPQVAGWVFAFLCIVALDATISAWSSDGFGPKFLATAQITMSFVCGVGALGAMLACGRTALAKIVRGLAIAIVCASIIELLAPQEWVNGVYDFLYSWRPTGVYSEVTRDENLWGWVRPRGLSTEPSFAGIFVGLFMLLDEILSKGTRRRRSFVTTLLLLIAAFVVIRSATIFYFAVLIFTRRMPSGYSFVIAGCLLFAGVTALLLLSLTPTGTSFFAGGSFFARVVAPYAVAVDVANAYPFFGLGIGSESEAMPFVSEVWSRYGAWSSFSYFYGKSAGLLITSNVAWIFIYLGIVGGLLFLWCSFGLLASIAGRAPALWAFFAIGLIWTTIGGFVDARTWAIFFSIAGALRLAGMANQQMRR